MSQFVKYPSSTPANNSITTDMIQDSAVANDKIASGAEGIYIGIFFDSPPASSSDFSSTEISADNYYTSTKAVQLLRSKVTTVVSSATISLATTDGFYAFTGGSITTWTLPDISSSLGQKFIIKNRGSAALTLQRASSDQLYTTIAVSSIVIATGASTTVINDGTYWNVL